MKKFFFFCLLYYMCNDDMLFLRSISVVSTVLVDEGSKMGHRDIPEEQTPTQTLGKAGP